MLRARLITSEPIRAKIDTGAVIGASLDAGAVIGAKLVGGPIGVVEADVPIYDGDYAITPDVDGQTVGTAGKMMRDDLTVEAIPYFDVSNVSGGSTVYIGGSIGYF